MSSDSIAQLIYLITFAVLLGGGFLLSRRLNISQTLQMASAWVIIFVGTIAAVGLWGDIQDDLFANQTRFDTGGSVIVPRRGAGHYFLTLDINGTPVNFIVDTGATDVVISRHDAEAIGLQPENLNYFGRAMTANGEVRTAPVRLDTVAIGPHEDTDVPAVVNQVDMNYSLLGMGYLNRWERIEISGGELTLYR